MYGNPLRPHRAPICGAQGTQSYIVVFTIFNFQKSLRLLPLSSQLQRSFSIPHYLKLTLTNLTAANLALAMATGTTMSRNQKDWDQAYNFLSTKTFDGTSHVDLRRLRRKVDWRIIPLMFLCYWLQFLDKVSLNVLQAYLMLECPSSD